MLIEYKPITEKDRKQYDDFASWVLENRTKVVATDTEGHTGYCYLENERIKKLGKTYIQEHLQLKWNSFLEQWEIRISENDYYNNTERYPIKEIPVSFVEIEQRTGREVYRGIDGRYYLRDVSTHEDFAKWFICGMKRRFEDGNDPRSNLIFVNGDQQERIRYDDWNDVAAYSDTFNRNFRQGGL